MEDDEEEEDEPAPPPVKKRGPGRPPKRKPEDGPQSPAATPQKRRPGRPPKSAQTPVAKRSRISQLGGAAEDYKGDFKMRRSGRQHFRPLEWWRNERFEYTRGEHSAIIKEVVHLPALEVQPLGKRPRAGHGVRAGSQARSTRKGSSVPPAEDGEDGWDNNTNPIAVVNEYPSGREVQRRGYNCVAEWWGLMCLLTLLLQACASRARSSTPSWSCTRTSDIKRCLARASLSRLASCTFPSAAASRASRRATMPM